MSSDPNDSETPARSDGRLNRRDVLGTIGTGVFAGVAGCGGNGGTDTHGSTADETDMTTPTDGTADATAPAGAVTLADVIPKPVEVTTTDDSYRITSDTSISHDGGNAAGVAGYLAELLRPPTGFDLPIEGASGDSTDTISLRLSGTSSEVGEEGYELTVTGEGATIRANAAAGLFAGVQTIRQVLPPAVESDSVESGSWSVPGGEVVDFPRFSYRGAHFDVARHFFPVSDLKRYIDYLALYKVNHFHIHLTDDQGWRIEIESWPKLTEIGGSTEVGGGEGGYYTQKEYEEIVSYAADRFITVVPEIDMPGHTNAALASYDKLNCDGTATDLYTGINVGFSSLCVDKEVTYEFVDDVLGEVADMTPGPYLHIGGDEADPLSEAEYTKFIDRVVPIVQEHGKRPMGWHQILAADPPSSVVGQYWSPAPRARGVDMSAAAEDGHELVVSPASHAYLDMKYDSDTELGLDWAGFTPLKGAYEWDPGSFVAGVEESSILGVEAALWSETLETFDDVEFMLFPRLPAIAELGWTPAERTGWEGFRRRLARHGPRWETLDVNYYRSPQVPWPGSGE